MAQEYKIIIQNEGQQTNEGVPSTTVQTPSGQVLEIKEDSGTTPQPKEKNKEKKIKDTLTYAVGAYIGKQAFSFVSSNITEWTGSPEASRAIDMGTTAIGYATALAINPVLGAISIGFDIGSRVYNTNRQMYYSNLEAQQLNIRSGRASIGQNGRNINYRR